MRNNDNLIGTLYALHVLRSYLEVRHREAHNFKNQIKLAPVHLIQCTNEEN